MSEANSVNSVTYRNVPLKEDEPQYQRFNGLVRNNSLELPLQYNSIIKKNEESQPDAPPKELAGSETIKDQTDLYGLQNGNLKTNDNAGNEKIIYSNVVSNGEDVNRRQDKSEQDFKLDAQAIREMYHNDLISGNEVNLSGGKSSPTKLVIKE